MKSKNDHNKKSSKPSYSEFDEKRNGLKPVKSRSGKSKRLSIYDDLDDEDMDMSLDDYSTDNFDFEDDDLYIDDDDY